MRVDPRTPRVRGFSPGTWGAQTSRSPERTADSPLQPSFQDLAALRGEVVPGLKPLGYSRAALSGRRPCALQISCDCPGRGPRTGSRTPGACVVGHLPNDCAGCPLLRAAPRAGVRVPCSPALLHSLHVLSGCVVRPRCPVVQSSPSPPNTPRSPLCLTIPPAAARSTPPETFQLSACCS